MKWLRLSGWVFLVLLAAVGLVTVLGSRLPEQRVSTATGVVGLPPAAVWGLLTDVAGEVGWRAGVKRVDLLPDVDGHHCWRESRTWMAVPLCTVESEAPRRWVTETVTMPGTAALPFSGQWTYELEPAGATGTRVTITERGTAGPAVWRFADHYLTGEDGQARLYLQELQAAAAARPLR